MKKTILTLGLLSSLSVSALTFHSGSSGFKASEHKLPTGVAQDTCQETNSYTGGCEFTKTGERRPMPYWDHSDKYEQNFLGTVNVEAEHRVLLNENNLLTLSGTISSGYRSEALTVDPYIEPRLELSTQISEDTFVITHAGLGRIGGSVEEKRWSVISAESGDLYEYSYATAKAWTDYEGVKLKRNDTVGVTLIHKFNWFLGTKQ